MDVEEATHRFNERISRVMEKFPLSDDPQSARFRTLVEGQLRAGTKFEAAWKSACGAIRYECAGLRK